MFDEQKIDVMVDGAYKKLKSYYYYDKTLLFIKKGIAIYETSIDFNDRMKVLKENLLKENEMYFNQLIDKMGIVVLPKKMHSQNGVESIIKNDIDYQKEINKVNFFINVPVELYIIDTLWMLFIGKIMKDIYGERKYSYAGRFKKSLFYEGRRDIYRGIDFESNRCFEPYFGLYSGWRDDALKTVRKNNEKNTVLIGMDIKEFYYNVDFEFGRLDEYLQYDERLEEFQFLTKVIKRIFKKYTKHIEKYKKSISKKDGICILPIGLLSSIVLREVYLRGFDMQMMDQAKTLFYGRYVDDILLVVEDSEENVCRDKEYYIKKFLLDNSLFYHDDGQIKSVCLPEMTVQTEKMSCFYFEKGKKDILIEAYYEQVDRNSSEVDLMPDMDLIRSSFYSRAYRVNLEGGSNKLRDIKILESNSYNVAKYINDLKRTLKNTASYDKEEIDQYLEQILYFYKGSVAIEYMLSWKALFELLIMCFEKEKANSFYADVKAFVENINEQVVDIADINEDKKEVIVQRVKEDIMDYLQIALSLAVALDYGCVNAERKEILFLAKAFRNSNLLNHQMVYFPLINYTKSSVMQNDSLLCNTKRTNIMNSFEWENEYSIDEFKIKWSPRFIHLNELYLWYFLCYFKSREYQKMLHTDIHRQFLEDNDLFYPFSNPILKNECIEDDVLIDVAWLSSGEDENIRVAIVNTRINEEDALNSLDDFYKNLSFERKRALYKILNTAVEEKVQYIIFPEFYLPYLWLDDLMKFAKQNNLTIISGLQYLTYGRHAYNITVVVSGSRSRRGFKNSVLVYREKNYYAPEEKVLLAKKGYDCEDVNRPFYNILKKGRVNLSTMLCYEFTDIYSRSALKSRINFLFVPQMNPDTRYFSSIVEATARDLYTFVIQANTSKYGDSRITAPAKTDFREIVQVKGGINDAVLVGKINIKEFEECKSRYLKELSKAISMCLNCNTRECERCTHKPKYKHEWYKGLPPRYDV